MAIIGFALLCFSRGRGLGGSMRALAMRSLAVYQFIPHRSTRQADAAGRVLSQAPGASRGGEGSPRGRGQRSHGFADIRGRAPKHQAGYTSASKDTPRCCNEYILKNTRETPLGPPRKRPNKMVKAALACPRAGRAACGPKSRARTKLLPCRTYASFQPL